MAVMAKLDHHTVIEAEVDEIPGICTFAFVPNDTKISSQLVDEGSKIPQLSLMWRYRSFNLLLNQQSELHLFSIELSLLDSDDLNQPVIKYSSQIGNSPSAVRKSQSSSNNNNNTTLILIKNQWHRFEGNLVKD